MKTLSYPNTKMADKGKYKSLASNVLFDWAEKNVKFHYGFGGENKDHLFIDVNDWGKVLDKANELISLGHNVFRLQTTSIKS